MCRKVQQSPLLLHDDHFSTFLSIKYCYGSCPAALHHSVSALATALWLYCTSSSSSVAAVDQIFYPERNQVSTWRVGELRFITPVGSEEITLWSPSPKEGFHKALMGYLFWVHLGWSDQSEIRQGNR